MPPMKKRLFLKTNVMVCTTVVIGFSLVVVLIGHASLMTFLEKAGKDPGILFGAVHHPPVTLIILGLILLTILIIVTVVIYRFNRQLLTITNQWAREHETLFEKATKELYEDIYELNVTEDRPANRATEEYFESLGAPHGAPFSTALAIVAEKQIKEEFRQGYLDNFLPENIIRAYQEGTETLKYEFMMTRDGENYYWMRIMAQIVLWESDNSLHVLTYRQNIDAEKRREQQIQRLASSDGMTGLLTKSVTEQQIDRVLQENSDADYAFFILDIDDFKQVNDHFGHVFGDEIIREFAKTLKGQFRKDDIIGRIGGDEFAVFVRAPDRDWAHAKAQQVVCVLNKDYYSGRKCWHISTSMGVSFSRGKGNSGASFYKVADKALYTTKKRSKNGFTLYEYQARH